MSLRTHTHRCGPRRLSIALFALLAPLALGACGATDEADRGADDGELAADLAAIEVRFVLDEFSIDAEQTAFRTGVPYRFVIENTSVLAHDFRITELGEAEAMAGMHVAGEVHEHGTELMMVHETDLPPGGTYTQEITFLRPGDFEIACHVAGHLQAGMHIPITIEGDVLAEATPIDPASITFDPGSMSDMPCHAMGITIMGDCSEADIERLRAEILDRSAGTMGGEQMDDDDHGHEPMSDSMMPGGMMPGDMMSEEMMAEMMARMMGGMMGEGMMGEGMMDEDMMHRMMERMRSGEMAERMRQRIVFDLASRRDEACQVVQPNTIIGACTPEDIARLVAEIMASMDEGEGVIDADPLDDDHPHGEGTEAGDEHDDSSGG